MARPLILLAASALLAAAPAAAGTLTTRYAFTGGPDGAVPLQSVVFDPAGNAYAEAAAGAAQCPTALVTGCGTVFKIAPNGTETTLVTFNGVNGAGGLNAPQSFGSLTLVHNRLYGTAAKSGGLGLGLLFAVDTSGRAYRVLHRFAGPDGAVPVETLRVTPGGILYGTTIEGGIGYTGPQTGNGVLFRVMPNGDFTVLHYFTGGADGANPQRIAIGPDGTLYGGTQSGLCQVQQTLSCGVIYSYAPSTGAFTVLHTFPYLQFGGQVGGVASNGTIYGSTFYAGAHHIGSLFALRPNPQGGFTYATLYSFTGQADGALPAEPPVLAPSGALIGTSSAPPGQSALTTTLYQYQAGKFTTLYQFSSNEGGPAPSVALATPTLGAGGLIYGTSAYGGSTAPCLAQGGGFIAPGCGTVYAFAP